MGDKRDPPAGGNGQGKLPRRGGESSEASPEESTAGYVLWLTSAEFELVSRAAGWSGLAPETWAQQAIGEAALGSTSKGPG